MPRAGGGRRRGGPRCRAGTRADHGPRRGADRGRPARAVAEAERSLRGAATSADVPEAVDGPIETVVDGLEAWRTRRAAQAEQAERSIREYEELTGLLDGRTAAELAAEAARLEATAETLTTAAGADAGSADGIDEASAAADVERQRERAASLAGALEVREADLLDVPAAEEAAAAARRRLEQVTELAGLIDETLGLLEAAQRQVHRDLAPLLAAAIRQWLPILSGGAYEEAG